ncbi:MAG: hypothetical protein RSA66_06175 [Muribaculaceae bacterium]
MNLSQPQIIQISELAKLLTPIRDIASLLDVNEDMLRLELLDKRSLASKTYYKAKAEISLQLRRQEIELANVGSPLAVQLTASYLINMDADEDL